MEDIQALEWWATFHRMPYTRKRELLTMYLIQKTGISCEIRLYRSVTRISLRTYKEKLGKLLKDDLSVQRSLGYIGIAPSTALHWYLQTKQEAPFKPDTTLCKDCPLNGLCEFSIPKRLWDGIQDKYSYLLVSKRMQHVLIKKERFKEAIEQRTGITDEAVILKMLRRIMERQYYRDDINLTPEQQQVAEALHEQGIGPVAVIKWFYIIKDSTQRLFDVAGNKMSADEAELLGLEELRQQLRAKPIEVKP